MGSDSKKKESIPNYSKSRQNPACFFKIMLGDFRQVLHIPPKFACTVGGLVKQDVSLRDSNGHSWKVKLIVKETHLVFQEGWHDFVLDHAIMLGDFLVFKYRRQAVFSVQIFGRNACERVNFDVKNCSNVGGVKRKATELHDKNIHYFKRKKTFEASKYKCKLNHCDSFKNSRKEKISSNGFAGSNHIIHEKKKIPTSLERVPIYKSDTPPAPFTSNYSRQLSHVIDQDIRKGDAKRVSPTLERVHMYKANTPPTLFPSDYSGPLGHKTDQDSMKHEPRKLSPVHLCEAPCDMMNNEEGNNSHIADLLCPDLLSTKEMLGDSLLRSHPSERQRYEDDMKILIALGEVICKFLLTEDGTCHIYDESLTKELGASILPDNDILIREKETCVSPEEKVVMPKKPLLQRMDASEVCCAEPVLNHTKLTADERANQRSNTAKANKQHEGKGKVADAFSQELKETVTPSLKENIKVELQRDMIDIPTRASVSCKFSLSLSAQTSWIALPVRLPSRLCKLRGERAIVLLQDPSMKLWPVLYYEGCRFIGFIGGWERFAMVNKLKKGDICEFEVVHGSQFTLRVHISRVQCT